MKSDYHSSSGLQRILAVVAASVLTGTLFAAVMFGLTGDEGWSPFARFENPSAPAAVMPA